MDYFDSKYDQPEELPEGFAWEDMEAGIRERMEQARPATDRRKWWSLVFLLLIGGCGAWMGYQRFNEKLTENTTNTTAPQTYMPLNALNGSNNQVPSPNTPKPTTTTASKNDLPNASTQQESRSSTVNKNSQKEKTAISISTVQTQEPNQATEKVLKSAPAESPNSAYIHREASGRPLNQAVVFLPALSIQPLPTPSETPQLENTPLLEIASENTPRTKSPGTFSWTFLAGIQNWNPKGTNNNRDYVSGFPGYTFSPQLHYHLNKTQGLHLGYQYQFLQELFEYEGTRIEQELLKDVVVQNVVNSYTGESIAQVKKDTLVEVMHYSREVKYNKFQLHSLQFGFSQQLLKGPKSKLDLSLGATYLFSLKGEGKRLDEEFIVQTITPSTFQAQQFALQAGINFHYAFNQKWSIMSRLEAQQYLTDWESATAGSTKPFTYGLLVGLRKKF